MCSATQVKLIKLYLHSSDPPLQSVRSLLTFFWGMHWFFLHWSSFLIHPRWQKNSSFSSHTAVEWWKIKYTNHLYFLISCNESWILNPELEIRILYSMRATVNLQIVHKVKCPYGIMSIEENVHREWNVHINYIGLENVH